MACIFRRHARAGDSPIRALGEFLGAGQRKEDDRRTRIHDDNRALGEALPAHPKLLLHRERSPIPAARLDPEKVGAKPLERLDGVAALVPRPSCDSAAAAKPTMETAFERSSAAGDVSL
jgi:hypothetical protein